MSKKIPLGEERGGKDNIILNLREQLRSARQQNRALEDSIEAMTSEFCPRELVYKLLDKLEESVILLNPKLKIERASAGCYTNIKFGNSFEDLFDSGKDYDKYVETFRQNAKLIIFQFDMPLKLSNACNKPFESTTIMGYNKNGDLEYALVILDKKAFVSGVYEAMVDGSGLTKGIKI